MLRCMSRDQTLRIMPAECMLKLVHSFVFVHSLFRKRAPVDWPPDPCCSAAYHASPSARGTARNDSASYLGRMPTQDMAVWSRSTFLKLSGSPICGSIQRAVKSAPAAGIFDEDTPQRAERTPSTHSMIA